ncbi:hypothetical protein VTH06DRAFT_7390 [Thermothelomyces fergusii]
MKANLLLFAPLAVSAAPALEKRQASESIDELIKAKGKLYFGTCTDQGRLTQGLNADIIRANFGQGQYTWGQADYLVDWAIRNNKTIRGHALFACGVQEVAVTELGIQNHSTNDYTSVAQGCLDEPKCVGVTVWGVRDPDSWRPQGNPLLFDSNYNPKASYNAIVDLLKQ